MQSSNPIYQKPVEDVVKRPSVKPPKKPVRGVQLALPRPESFPIEEGMSPGQKVSNTILQNVSKIVQYDDNNIVSPDVQQGAVTYFYRQITGDRDSIPSIEKITGELFGEPTDDLTKAYEMVVEASRQAISLDPIKKLNELTQEQVEKKAYEQMKDRGEVGVEYTGGYSTMPWIAPNKRTEYIKDQSPDAMEKGVERYRFSEYMKAAPFATFVAGKDVSPEVMRAIYRAGLIKDKDKRMEYWESQMGKGGALSEKNSAFEGYRLPPQVEATITNAVTQADNDLIKAQEVFDAKAVTMDDTTYANAIMAVDSLQELVPESGIGHFLRSSVSVLGDKYRNIKGYFQEGQGYDLFHLRNNAESVARDLMTISKGENPFNPDGSVKPKFEKDAKWVLGTHFDMHDNANPMSAKEWLAHGAYDYYNVGKANMLYERRMRSYEDVVRTNYTGKHGIILEQAGNIVGTVVDMLGTMAVSAIPYAGVPLAMGSLYASTQYEFETGALDAGVRPDQARFWSSFFSIPYAMSEYSQVKALEPKAWRPILEDIKKSPSTLHKSLLVGLGVKTEGEVFTQEEIALLRKARTRWGVQNYLKVTAHETGEEYVQSGFEYAYWSTLALSNPDAINLDQKRIQMFSEMLSATVTMPFVTLFGQGMARVAMRMKGFSDDIHNLQYKEDGTSRQRDEVLLYLANNSVIQQTGNTKVAPALKDIPEKIIKMVESVFSYNADKTTKGELIPIGEDFVEDESTPNTIEGLRSDLIAEGYSNPDEVIYNVRSLLQKRNEIIEEIKKGLREEEKKRTEALVEGEKFNPTEHPVKIAAAERLHNVLKGFGGAGNLDVVETPKEASEKYGEPLDKVATARGFYDTTSDTIVIISGNNEDAAQAEESYIHEAVHSSPALESRLAEMAKSALEEFVDEEEDELSKAKYILHNDLGYSTTEIDKMSENQIYAEIGASAITKGISGEESEATSPIFKNIAKALLQSNEQMDVSEFLKAVALMKEQEGRIGPDAIYEAEEELINSQSEENPKARIQNLSAVRETAIRVAELRRNGRQSEAEALLAREAENKPDSFINDVNELVEGIEKELDGNEDLSVREAELWAFSRRLAEKASEKISKAKESAIEVLSDAERRAQINRLLRQMARVSIAPNDVRKFNEVEVILALNSKIDSIIKEGGSQEAIKKEIYAILKEHLDSNKDIIDETVERISHVSSIPDELLTAGDAHIAVTRELLKGFIKQLESYHPSRAKLIANTMAQSWRADSQEQLLLMATDAITKIAYRPSDKAAQKTLISLFQKARPEARNLPWFERKLSGENLKKVMRWKDLHNMTNKKAEKYIAQKMNHLAEVQADENSTLDDIYQAVKDLEEAQKFAGLKNKTPAAYSDALAYAEDMLDEKAVAEAQAKIEALNKQRDALVKILDRRKGKKLTGFNTMSFYDIQRSIFGESQSAEEIINSIRDLVDMGTNTAAEFKQQFGTDALIQMLTARTGLKVRELRKLFRKLGRPDARFKGCYLKDSEMVLTPDAAMNAVLAYMQPDQQAKAEATFDMEKIQSRLTDTENAIIESLQKIYEEEGKVIKVYVKDKLGLSFKTVKNYAPIRLASEINPASGKTLRANIVPGFIIERTDNSKELSPDAGAIQIFESHTANAAVFVGMFDATVMMRHTLISPQVLEKVKRKYGMDAEKVLREFSIAVATQRTARNATIGSENAVVNTLLSAQMLPLFYNTRSAFRQLTSIPITTLENDVSFRTVLQGLSRAFSDDFRNAWNYIRKSGVMQERWSNNLAMELGRSIGEKDEPAVTTLQRIMSSGLAINKRMDMLAIRFIAPAVLQNEIDRINAQGVFKGDQEQVMKLALARTLGRINATQQSTQIAYRSYSHLQHGGLRSLMFPFTSTLQQFASFELRAINVWREADGAEKTQAFKRMANVFFLNHFVGPAFYTLLGALYNAAVLGADYDDDDKKKELLVSLGTSMLVGPLAGILFSGTIIKGCIEFGVRKASGVDTYPTNLLGSTINLVTDPSRIYKSTEEAVMVAREAQYSDPVDVFEVFLEVLGFAPPVKQLKKGLENRDIL